MVSCLPKAFHVYVERLYSRRQHWARPWVGTHFTAGAESTQRVEKIHHILKVHMRSSPTLMDVFHSVEKRIQDERHSKEHAKYLEDVHVRANNISEALKHFTAVEELNNKFLGRYASGRMKFEMAASFYYQAYSIGGGHVDDNAVERLPDQASLGALKAILLPEELVRDPPDVNVLENEASNTPARQQSVDSILGKFKDTEVEGVFSIFLERHPHMAHYIILFADGKGEIHDSSSARTQPVNGYMEYLRDIFPPKFELKHKAKEDQIVMEIYSDLTGKSKHLVDMSMDDPRVAAILKAELDRLYEKLQAEINGEVLVQDPVMSVKTG
ncbi:hypothetical protein BGZ99_009068 [Dissophora globulifera]|uniref:Uncharacterized protein n=1 Tax=Dissophora globulifera TaxID=979702 RepID=A0A9P6R8A5_9FUNG|nr:hypothetical protein BGZ99_009068 [Dissophora globulifera]